MERVCVYVYVCMFFEKIHSCRLFFLVQEDILMFPYFIAIPEDAISDNEPVEDNIDARINRTFSFGEKELCMNLHTGCTHEA